MGTWTCEGETYDDLEKIATSHYQLVESQTGLASKVQIQQWGFAQFVNAGAFCTCRLYRSSPKNNENKSAGALGFAFAHLIHADAFCTSHLCQCSL